VFQSVWEAVRNFAFPSECERDIILEKFLDDMADQVESIDHVISFPHLSYVDDTVVVPLVNTLRWAMSSYVWHFWPIPSETTNRTGGL